MAGVLTGPIAVGHHRSPISLIRLALSGAITGTQGIWVILGCEMLISEPISGISLDASASLLIGHARPSTTSGPEQSLADEYTILPQIA
jgi:hypothetical protein